VQQRNERFGVGFLDVDVAVREHDDVVKAPGVDVVERLFLGRVALDKCELLVPELGREFGDRCVDLAVVCDHEHAGITFDIVVELADYARRDRVPAEDERGFLRWSVVAGGRECGSFFCNVAAVGDDRIIIL
jgi:hypothetical protein